MPPLQELTNGMSKDAENELLILSLDVGTTQCKFISSTLHVTTRNVANEYQFDDQQELPSPMSPQKLVLGE